MEKIFQDIEQDFPWFNYPDYLIALFGELLKPDFVIDYIRGTRTHFYWDCSEKIWIRCCDLTFRAKLIDAMVTWLLSNLSPLEIKLLVKNRFVYEHTIDQLYTGMAPCFMCVDWAKGLDLIPVDSYLVGKKKIFDSAHNVSRGLIRDDKLTNISIDKYEESFNFGHIKLKTLKHMNNFSSFRVNNTVKTARKTKWQNKDL